MTFKALLNDEGKKLWGYAFPSGEIPVESPIPVKITVEDQESFPDVYMVAWGRLSLKEKTSIIDYFHEKVGATETSILADIVSKGLPLRASLVQCVSMPLRFFI